MGGCDLRLFNVVFLGLSFTLIFTAFQTCSMVEETVLKGAKAEPNSTFTGDGYTSLGIIYGVFAASNFVAPSVIAVVGPRISMLIGGFLYCLFIASFLQPMNWSLYLGSVLVGLGAAVLWTAQGSFLTLNSSKDTLGRNSGIFWALLQCSLLFGNLFIYFEFGGEVEVTKHIRTTLFIVLTAVGFVGLLLLLVLRKPPASETDDIEPLIVNDSDTRSSTALDALKKSFMLLGRKDILLLCVFIAYTGFELSFWSGVYGTCVGATGHFGARAKSLLGLVGMVIGAGEITGGALFGILGKKTNKYGRDPVVLLGFISHMIAIYLVFLSLPEDSPLVKITNRATYITPREYVILMCAFLLGFGDSSFNTQIYSIIGSMFPKDSAPAFAIYKFVQSVAAALGFVYSQYLLLQWQLLILVVFAVLGTVCFFSVEWSLSRPPGLAYTITPQHDLQDSEEDDSELDSYDDPIIGRSPSRDLLPPEASQAART